MMRLRLAAIVVALATVTSSVAAYADVPAPSANASASAAPTASARDLDAAIAKLADPDLATRKAGALAIVDTPPDAIALLEVRLLRAPEAGPGPMWLAIDKARKSIGKEKKDDEPIGELLDAVVTSGNGPGARSLALLLAGMQACEKQAGVAGARIIVKLSVDDKGLLKSIGTSSIKRLGDHAVAALIEVRRDSDKELRGFANRMLDTLGKFLPSDAVQVKDPQDLADVLVAFGKIRDQDAIRVILSYLNADRAQVREAARWSIAQFGADARPALKETYDNFTGDRAPDEWSAEKILAGLVEAYDKVRLADVYKLFDEGIAARDAGKLEEAVAAFDALLARAPTFERKAELAPTYVDLAQKKASADDRAGARTLLGKALRLAQGTPLASTIESELDTMDAQDLLDHGVADVTLLQRAVELDPNNVVARDMLQRLQNDSGARDAKVRRWAASGAVGLLVIVAAILFLGRGKKNGKPPMARKPVRI
jgi:tetratricopeptide (TPR) repeat protein